MRHTIVGILLLLCPMGAAADVLTFSFIGSSPEVNMTASASGFTMGPAMNLFVTDVTAGVTLDLAGDVTASTGTATSFIITPILALGDFTGGGIVRIADGTTVLLAGITADNSAFIAALPDGTGAWLAGFTVTFVNPSVLERFGLNSFDPNGSIAATFAHDHVVDSTVEGTIGGGTVTITSTFTPIPEPAALGLIGSVLLMICGACRLLGPSCL